MAQPITITIPDTIVDEELRVIAYCSKLIEQRQPLERGRIIDYLRQRWHPQAP